VKAVPAEDKSIVSTGNVDAGFNSADVSLAAQYYVPHQMHASIGPSCVVADVRADGATIWSPTQSSFLTRNSVAAMLGMAPEKMRLVWTEGAGCYGQNGADDCTADAVAARRQAGALAVDAPRRARQRAQGRCHGHDSQGRPRRQG
jgi:nicotinate dehydrogenase subunit B